MYVSHQCENQTTSPAAVDPSGGAPVPPSSWTLRLDARLEAYGRQGKTSHRAFSTFLRSLVIQLGDGRRPEDLIEWHKTAATPETDGFEVRRAGTTDVPAKILLTLDYQPERFRLSPPLAHVVDLELATKPQVVLALWQYIKLHKLQESDEKKVVNNDDTLRALFACDKMSFSEIPARLEPHLLPPEPIELEYLVAVERPEGSAIWDIDVEIDDPSKPRPISANLVAQQREISLLEQRISEVSTALRAATVHEHLLLQFAEDPVGCIRRLMAAQCADLEVAAGEPAITLSDLERARNFDTEEIERAVTLFVNSTKPNLRP